jgi:hypothetical protein
MENNELNKRVQDLLNYLEDKRIVDRSEYLIFRGIGRQEGNELWAFMLDQGFMSKLENKVGRYKITPKGNLLTGDRYIKQVQEAAKLKPEKEERETQESEKFKLELKQIRRQSKIFWPGFIIAVVGGLLGLATFIFKVTEKPKTETKYIGVDSKGHVIEFTVKKN